MSLVGIGGAGRVERETLRALRFRDLMPYRVAKVLLVSSPYDAFILEQDGQLTEQVFREYTHLHLPSAPRFTHAPSGEAALELLYERRFDLVVAMTSLTDVDINAFGLQVKALDPSCPVVLLALDRRELHDIRPQLDVHAIDGAFLWSGDPKILLAIIMYVEDRQNLDTDIERGNVRVIIVVEDSPHYYSSFLSLLYRELLAQARSLYVEGVNEILRQMYMKTRPKVLLATSYEEGRTLLERYRSNLLALISDIELPRAGGQADTEEAGLELVRLAREQDRDLPVLVQSAHAEHAAIVESLDVVFIDKRSPRLLARIRTFVTEALGFGDFVFRDRTGKELARARDLREFTARLEEVPEESITYHARHNHFSIWLMARSEFALAERIRPRRVSEFPDVAAVRKYLLDVLKRVYREIHRGVVSDFNRHHFRSEPFSRLGKGALGGKARGLAFLNMKLADLGEERFAELAVELPKTVVVTVEHFDAFLDDNDLRQAAYASEDDAELSRLFLGGRLDPALLDDLRFIAEQLDVPLAVRSSSLLEDSQHQPLAGIYATVMFANRGSLEERTTELAMSLKLVYASVFWRDARAYLRSRGLRVEEEKMAVIIQPLIGRGHGRRFYPTIAGLAQSYNFYALAPQRPEDGIVHMALGLGRQVVEGGRALRFCPEYPDVIPQFVDPRTFLDTSQRQFFALALDHERFTSPAAFATSVQPYGLDRAEKDGPLQIVGSVFSADDQQIRDDLSLRGPRLVTFNNLLKHQTIPLAETLSRLLSEGSEGFGGPVEIEFAVDMVDFGSVEPPVLYLLQIRPQAAYRGNGDGGEVRFAAADRLCASSQSLGHGVMDALHDLVYVRRDRWRSSANRRIAEEVGAFNAVLDEEQRPYLLIGPGRWGTAEESLGIPVRWSQISGARVIIEASPAGYAVEPSQGTHFFQNITSLGIGYLSLEPGSEGLADEEADGLDWDWLDAAPSYRESEHLRWLRFDRPLTVILDGRRGQGVIVKPGAVAQAGD